MINPSTPYCKGDCSNCWLANDPDYFGCIEPP